MLSGALLLPTGGKGASRDPALASLRRAGWAIRHGDGKIVQDVSMKAWEL